MNESPTNIAKLAAVTLSNFCQPGDTGCVIPMPLPPGVCGTMPVEDHLELLSALFTLHSALAAGADPNVVIDVLGRSEKEDD